MASLENYSAAYSLLAARDLFPCGLATAELPERCKKPARAPYRSIFAHTLTPTARAAWVEYGWNVFYLHEAPAHVKALLIIDARIQAVMRKSGDLMQRGVVLLPAEGSKIVPHEKTSLTDNQQEGALPPWVNYVKCSGLNGHYLEFGVFYGLSFYNNFYDARHWLKKFYAFDSFAGLSTPLDLETTFTGGGFKEGEYCCNQTSFEMTGALCGVDTARIEIVPGFYSETLRNKNPTAYGLEKESVSVAYIDCDLLEPTRDVLDFITPLMETGGLIYFDDWRLCRASPHIGERGAALRWLEKHPHLELIELDRPTWQSQWFIMQKK